MVLLLSVDRCLVCKAGRHNECRGRIRSPTRVRRLTGRMSREVVWTTCECWLAHHKPGFTPDRDESPHD